MEKLFRRLFLYDYDRYNKHTMTKLFRKNLIVMYCGIWYYLYNFKKREKYPWRSVTFNKFSKVANLATLLKVTLLHGSFRRFLNCTNGSKSRKASN